MSLKTELALASNPELKQLIENFDDMGVFTLPFDESAPTYNIRKLDEYCKQHNKEPNELTDKELKVFQTN